MSLGNPVDLSEARRLIEHLRSELATKEAKIAALLLSSKKPPPKLKGKP